MKQIVLLRNDLRSDNPDFFLDVPMGKLATLFAHLSAHSVYFQTKHNSKKIEKWMRMPHKVCLAVGNEQLLKLFIKQATQKNIFVLSQSYHKKQIGLEMIAQLSPDSPNYIQFDKWGIEGQSWQSESLASFDGLIGATFGPEENQILDPIFGQLPLFKF